MATPIVLVHGNPETAVIWEPMVKALREHTDAAVLPLSPPGFGAPVPAGFAATREDYVAWLIGELEAVGRPVHLVGHDWGGGHVAGVAIERPDLLVSWCIDIAGCFEPEYVWHDFARIWQTQGAGEDQIAEMLGAPVDARAALFESVGLDAARARQVAAGFTPDMGRCILALYRSAAQPAMAALGARLPQAAARPGLVVIPTEDGYTGGEALAQRAARRAGASVAVLDGLGHWWMIEDPAGAADTLLAFWADLD